MHTNSSDCCSLVYNIVTDNFYIAGGFKARFNTSSYSCSCPLPMGINKKVIGLLKDELGRMIMTDFVALRPQGYTYKMFAGSGDKKCKGVKKCIVKKTLDFEDYKQCLFISRLECV